MTEARDTTKVQCKRVRSCTLNTTHSTSLRPRRRCRRNSSALDPHTENRRCSVDDLAPAKLVITPATQSGARLSASSKQDHFGEPTTCHLSAQAVDQWPLAELMLRVISRIIHERTFPKYFQSDVHMCSGVPNRVLLDYL